VKRRRPFLVPPCELTGGVRAQAVYAITMRKRTILLGAFLVAAVLMGAWGIKDHRWSSVISMGLITALAITALYSLKKSGKL